MKKRSIQTCVEKFKDAVGAITRFVKRVDTRLISKSDRSWLYDYAIIRLYREFEVFVLSVLVTEINRDTSLLSDSEEVRFPKHLNDEVCEYIIVGGRNYFGFSGISELVGKLNKFLPEGHSLVKAVGEDRQTLEKLLALRNFAAHNSKHSKRKALDTVRPKGPKPAKGAKQKQKRLASAGSYLKRKESVTRKESESDEAWRQRKDCNRFENIVKVLEDLADRIKNETN